MIVELTRLARSSDRSNQRKLTEGVTVPIFPLRVISAPGDADAALYRDIRLEALQRNPKPSALNVRVRRGAAAVMVRSFAWPRGDLRRVH